MGLSCVRMRNPTARLIALVSACLLTACEEAQSQTFYVTVPAAQTSHFIRDLLALASDIGLKSKAGSATDDNGHTLNVVEGSGSGLRLWAQNLPLSVYEAKRCGLADVHVHPELFILSVESFWPWLATATRESSTDMARRLVALGYQVAGRPSQCVLGLPEG